MIIDTLTPLGSFYVSEAGIAKGEAKCEPAFQMPLSFNQNSTVKHKKEAGTSGENCFSYSIRELAVIFHPLLILILNL